MASPGDMFPMAGMREQELLEQLIEYVRTRFFGKYRGLVVDTADPTERGRLKVKVPAVLGESTLWAMPCVPYAGEGVGLYLLPKADTGVWVEFEGGDPSYPIWSGCFWADGELPDASDENIKILKTEKITFRLDDENDEMLSEVSSGSKITIGEDVITESGESTVTVGSDGVVSEKGNSTQKITSSNVEISSGATKTEHSAAAFAVNGESFKVMS